MSQNQETIASAIVTHLGELIEGADQPGVLGVDTDLIATGLLDSLNIVRLIQFVETQFNLNISDDDIGPELFTSANALATYVVSNR